MRVEDKKALHFCWVVEPWKESRAKYLLAWQKLGWHCVLWHSGQIVEPPVEGVELQLVDDLIQGSLIEEVFNYERSYGSHASCADLFRYLVLYELGGAYVDIDVFPDPVGENRPELPEPSEPLFGIPSQSKGLAFEIRFIRSPAKHELLSKLIQTAVQNEQGYLRYGGYKGLVNSSIIGRTGPVMAEKTVQKYAHETGRVFRSFLIRATLDDTTENRRESCTRGFFRAVDRVRAERKDRMLKIQNKIVEVLGGKENPARQNT